MLYHFMVGLGFFAVFPVSHSDFILNSNSPDSLKLSTLVYLFIVTGDTCFERALSFTSRSKELNLKVFEEKIYDLLQYSLFQTNYVNFLRINLVSCRHPCLHYLLSNPTGRSKINSAVQCPTNQVLLSPWLHSFQMCQGLICQQTTGRQSKNHCSITLSPLTETINLIILVFLYPSKSNSTFLEYLSTLYIALKKKYL